MRVVPFGDSAVLVELEQRIDARLVARAAAIADAWDLGEAVPAYASALLRFDPLATSPDEALARATRLAGMRDERRPRQGRLVEIAVRYGGPDLEETAALSGMSAGELVALHAAREYRAFFLGFMPGFAYCGTLDPRIVAPRLHVPRPRVPAGAVAVADGQTAVYPFDSPGGWRIIGATDTRVFDPASDQPALVRAGDRVRFRPA
ncbi:MAG TPA: 5-oxoprolinase subunit PxpB [Candidatus Limnocylindria bacterium]|nr:5-oxoprolinase subunit PxpB [Candidatus Limnocylindria bacterium]